MQRYCIPFPAPLAAPRDTWLGAGQEPALEEVLADPLVHLVMRRDGVTPGESRFRHRRRASTAAGRSLLPLRRVIGDRAESAGIVMQRGWVT